MYAIRSYYDEAALFVGDLFGAYLRYAELRGWKVELMDSSPIV